MLNRKGRFSTNQSKDTSRRLKSATIGTHVRRLPTSSRHMNADSVGFSNPRKKNRAARGFVETITPQTSSGESASAHARRVSRREFTHEMQHKVRMRRIAILTVVFVVVAAVALGVGAMTFFSSVDAKLSLSNSDAKSVLVTPQENSPYYALVVADLSSTALSQSEQGPEAVVLARIDEEQRAVTLVSIPSSLQVVLKDGKAHKLREAVTEGDAALIKAVATFANVDIAHFAKIDEAGMIALVDKLGGIEINVAQEVDDPQAGDEYLAPGTQTLNGAQAVTFLRAQNFKNGLEDQTKNQRDFFAALATRMVHDGGGLSFAALLDSVGSSFQTDVSTQGAMRLASALKGMEPSLVQGALVPGYESTRDEVKYYFASSDAWSVIMQLVNEGKPPVLDKDMPVFVDKGSFTLDVRNGAGIASGASQAADLLRSEGFDVVEVGNADSSEYPETLVVYDGEENKAKANEVVASLGIGRAIVGMGNYTYESDVLLILGKDWKPLS